MIDAFYETFKDKPSEILAELFSIAKKKEAIKFCHKNILPQFDLSRTVAGCRSIGYRHFARFFDSNVDHIWVAGTKGEFTPDILRKTYKQLSKESKRTCFHFFLSESDPRIWHLIFFDTTEDSGNGRFAHGAHVHFINHLWGLDGDEILGRLPERPGGNPVHLRIE